MSQIEIPDEQSWVDAYVKMSESRIRSIDKKAVRK